MSCRFFFHQFYSEKLITYLLHIHNTDTSIEKPIELPCRKQNFPPFEWTRVNGLQSIIAHLFHLTLIQAKLLGSYGAFFHWLYHFSPIRNYQSQWATHWWSKSHTHTNENEAKKNERIDFNTTENWKERWAHFSISPKTHTREHL